MFVLSFVRMSSNSSPDTDVPQRYVCSHRREYIFSLRNVHIKIQKKNYTCTPHRHTYIYKDARTETHADINAFTHTDTRRLFFFLYFSCPWLYSLLLSVTTEMFRKCVFIFSVGFLCRSQFHGNQIKKQKNWVFASLMIKKKKQWRKDTCHDIQMVCVST